SLTTFSRPSVARSLHSPKFVCGQRSGLLVGKALELAKVMSHLLADELGLGLRGSDARPLVIGLVGELVNGAVDAALAAHAEESHDLLEVELRRALGVEAVTEPVARGLHRLRRPELKPNGLEAAQRLH